jgi:hypothetical protein
VTASHLPFVAWWAIGCVVVASTGWAAWRLLRQHGMQALIYAYLVFVVLLIGMLVGSCMEALSR